MSQDQAARILESPQFPSPDADPSPSPPPRSQSRRRSPGPSRRRSPSPSRSQTPRPSRRPLPREETRRRLEEDLVNANSAAPVDASPAAAAAEAEEPDGRTTLRGAIADLAEAGAKGAAKKRDATEADWADFIGTLFGFLSMVLVWWLVLGKGWKKQDREPYELTDDECDALATPAARIMARSWINARWGKHILGASDYILLALVMFDYTDRVRPLVQERMRDLRRTRQGGTGQAGAAPAAPPPPPAPAPPPQEERNGIVAQPEAEEPRGWSGVYPANLT